MLIILSSKCFRPKKQVDATLYLFHNPLLQLPQTVLYLLTNKLKDISTKPTTSKYILDPVDAKVSFLTSNFS